MEEGVVVGRGLEEDSTKAVSSFPTLLCFLPPPWTSCNSNHASSKTPSPSLTGRKGAGGGRGKGGREGGRGRVAVDGGGETASSSPPLPWGGGGRGAERERERERGVDYVDSLCGGEERREGRRAAALSLSLLLLCKTF